MKYRHEWKHEINYADMLILRRRLLAVAKVDANAIDGTYFVRSIYFDNANDKALREKIDGVNHREKFRLRYYNHDSSSIKLEKKSKQNSLCCKQSLAISKEQVQYILNGDYSQMVQSGEPLIQELYAKIMQHGLRPKTIVDYTREPFVFVAGNVRVTLDYDIRTGMGAIDFLNPNLVTIPAGDAPIILEVKWDEFLPDVIRDIVQLEGRHVTAFSKYAACRVYG